MKVMSNNITEICLAYRSLDPIPREQERILFSKYRYLCDRLELLDKHDPEYKIIDKQIEVIKDRVVRSNIRFVCVVARQFVSRFKVEMEDVVSEGVMGLLRAMTKFSISEGTRFISYAVYWIRNHIERSLEHRHVIRFNYGVIRNLEGFKRDRHMVEQILERSVSLEEAVEYNDGRTSKPTWSPETWSLLESPISSLDVQYGNDEYEGGTILSKLVDQSIGDPMDGHSLSERKNYVNTLIDGALDFREKKVVEWFYGLNGHPSRTCDTIANTLNFSRQRVSQILDGAHRKIERHSKLIGAMSSN